MPAILTNTGNDSKATKSAMRGANSENFNPIVSGRSFRPPLRTIYFYSVAKRSFTVRHPLVPKLHLRGCEEGERYVRCASIPDPLPQACPDQERGGTRIDDNDGRMVAIDILNPGNLTFDQYFGSSNPNFFANTNGTNLVAEGLFFSENEEPTEEELKRAEDARDKHFRYLAKESQRLAAVSTKQLNEFLQRYPDTHIALDALGIETNYHTANLVKVSCPNCGDAIKQGIAFHQSSAGILCIIDPDRALKAGAINKERYTELTGKGFPGRPKSE